MGGACSIGPLGEKTYQISFGRLWKEDSIWKNWAYVEQYF
jgi:hypothetical protein